MCINCMTKLAVSSIRQQCRSHTHHTASLSRPYTTVPHHLSRVPTAVSHHTYHNTHTRSFSTTDRISEQVDRGYRILGVQQIAIGGKNKSDLKTLWCDLFGLQQVSTFKSEKENVNEDILVCGAGDLGTVEIDIMEPLDSNKKPAVDQPPLNHIGLWVDDIHKCVEYLQSKKVRFAPGGIRKGAAGHEVTFLHPKGNSDLPFSGCGVLIELVQAPKNVVDAYEKATNAMTEVVQ